MVAINKDQTDINTLIKTAETLIKAKRYKDAMKAYCEVIEADRTHSETWLILGECLVILGRDKEAIKCFDGCLMTDDPYDIPAFYQAGMAYSRLGNRNRASDYHDKALLVDKRTELRILDQSWLSKKQEIIGKATEVHISVGAWRTDYGGDKVTWYPFKWTNEDLLFMFGGTEPHMIGKAKTQDMAQKIAERWLDGWLKFCGAASRDYPVDIEGVKAEKRFSFLLRSKRDMSKGEFIFLWRDGKVIPLKGMAIGHSEVEVEAFQIAYEWLRERIWDK